MKHLAVPLFVLSVCAHAQSALPAASAPKSSSAGNVKPETVLFKVGDRPVTAAEFEKILGSFPPEIQQGARSNPRQVMQSYFLMQNLAKRAEDEKLDQASPYKEQLALQRAQYLATTVVNRQSGRINVTDDEVKARYEGDKAEKYDEAKISAIMVMFVEGKAITAKIDMSDPSKAAVQSAGETRPEPEAKKLSEELVARLRSGGDFAALARQYSDDKTSAAKGGDFGVVHRADRVPDEIKKVVFSLKPGEVSDPIRQPMGYYIVKLERRSQRPFDEVKQTVANEIRQERFQDWMKSLQKQFEITVEEPSYFQQASAAIPSASDVKAPASVTPGNAR